MSLLFAAISATIFLSVCARGGVSNSYLPAHSTSKGSSGPVWSGALAVPMVLSDGTIAETPEVAAARATHLAALEAARASDPDMGKDDGEYNPQKYGDHLYGVVAHSDDLLQAILSYQALAKGSGAPGSVHGTPGTGMQSLTKVMSDASAGGAVYGAPATGTGRASTGAPGPAYGVPAQPSVESGYEAMVEQNMPYSGPLAMLQLLASGYLADTPEVVAARNIHFKALQDAQAAADLWRAKQAAAGGAQTHPWG